MPDISAAAARLIAAHFYPLLYDTTTTRQVRETAQAAADAVLALVDITGQPADEYSPVDTEFVPGAHVRLLADDSKLGEPGHTRSGVIAGVLSTGGEVHTVRVHWPDDNTTTSHHPSELEVMPF